MISEHIKLIKKLPLFASLEECVVDEILKESCVSDLEKGALLFQEGEKPLRFYVVLEGWVKLFRLNEEGEESVIKVVGLENVLDGFSVFIDLPFSYSAEIIEDVKILSIPADTFQSRVKSNPDLANAMLASLAQQYKDIANQIAMLTLKSAKQRVGWFLLDLALKNGKKMGNVDLPYSKFLIASFLGMTPETFSRVLKQFKGGKGVLINKSSINLDDDLSLCEFCDSQVATKCDQYRSGKCSNPNI